MRIALTYNLRRDDGEACAEFDSRETIEAIAALVEGLGHEVTPLDVTGSIPRLVAGLSWIRPELVLNLAEGERGAFREAFYPALFEQLGYPHTGSSASVLALCLDKALAKRVVAAAGVAVPAGELIRDAGLLRRTLPQVPLPALVKPNFEGSSKGITTASIVTTRAELAPLVGELLDRYPDGVLVEQFIDGLDVSVAWVDGLGVLPPFAYRYPVSGAFAIYDYALKTELHAQVHVEIPARVGPHVTARLEEAATSTFAALGVAGYGRADFRVTPAGEVVFLEMNPLPSLVPGDDDLYGACALLGKTPHELFAYILGAADRALDSPRAVTGAR
jgi:D-alanine-D-alanine ligase